MSPTLRWQVDLHLRRLLPSLTALVAVLLDLLPLPGMGSVTSFLTLGVVYYWSIYRPELLPAPAVFAVGVVYDALAGLPLGLTSLVLLLVRAVLDGHRRFFVARSFMVVWSCFLLLAPLAEAARWVVGCLWWGRLFPPQPVLFELGLSLALYPCIGWLLGHVHGRIPRGGGGGAALRHEP